MLGLCLFLGLWPAGKGHIFTVHKAFLKGDLDDNKDKMYMYVSQGFENTTHKGSGVKAAEGAV